MDLFRQIVHSPFQAVKQRLRQWTQPSGSARTPNAPPTHHSKPKLSPRPASPKDTETPFPNAQTPLNTSPQPHLSNANSPRRGPSLLHEEPPLPPII